MHNNPFILHNDSNTTASSSSSLPITVVSISNCSSPITTNNTSSPLSTVDNHCQITSPIHVTNFLPMITRAKADISKPKVLHTFVTNDYFEPSIYKQAMTHPQWLNAMQFEYHALVQNNTWTLTSLPAGANLVGCKWVFKMNHNSDGSLQRYKARLVAKSFQQFEGYDFTDAFSPVIKPTTIRLVLTIALTSRWPIHQIDINNAFLHGELSSLVYMQQPPGFSTDSTLVYQLNKAIYGLKQAPHACFQKLLQIFFIWASLLPRVTFLSSQGLQKITLFLY